MVSIEINEEIFNKIQKMAKFIGFTEKALIEDILDTTVKSLEIDPSTILTDYLDKEGMLNLIFNS